MKYVGLMCLLAAVSLWGCERGGKRETVASEAKPAGGTETGAARPTAAAPSEAPKGFYAFTVQDLDGADRHLADYRGQVVLVVNVASKCGFTPQYAGLEKLYKEYAPKGLVIIGVPSNDFRQQEPGTAEEIKAFCTEKYGVTFPLLAKVSVKNGPEQAPLYQYLTQKDFNGVADAKVSWNFNKFLIGKDGRWIKHYESKVTPEDAGLRADIDAALKG